MEITKRKNVEKVYKKWNEGVKRVFRNKTPKERFLILTVFFIHVLLGAIFSLKSLPYTELSVGVPLADALICSSSSGLLGAYVGSIYGAVLTKTVSFSRCFILTVMLVLRIAVSVWRQGGNWGRVTFLGENALVKTGYAAFMAFVQCAFHITVNGIYDGVWVRLLATLIALPTVTAIFSFFFAGCPKKNIGKERYVERTVYEIAMTLFFMAVVYALKDMRYFGVSLASLTAMTLTLLCSSKGGFLRGAVLGALLGSIYSPVLTLSYAVLGGVSGLFYGLGVLPAAGISAFAGTGAALMQVGYTALIGFVPETVIAVAIASPVIRYSFVPERFPYPKNESFDEYAELSEAETRVIHSVRRNGDIILLSETLRGISETLKSGGGDGIRTRPHEICAALCEEFCDTCALNSICWETEKERSEKAVDGIIEAAKRGEILPKDSKTNYLSGYCIKFKELSEEIKRLSAFKRIDEEKTPLFEATASDLGKVADILSDMIERSRLEETRDTDAEKTVRGVVSSIGFKPDGISVMGTDRKKIYAYGIKGAFGEIEEENEKIRRALSEAFKTQYGAPRISGDISDCMIFSPEKTLSTRVTCLRSTKDGEPCSGDSARVSEVDDGYFYAVIADGMGSGEEAKRTSGTAISILEKLLKCRVKKSLATELVGDILRRRKGESFTTVDIMELDLVSGKASFLKSGAAASYVIRNGGVYCINACSMPVGITGEAHPEEISFKLAEGDTVLMLSDGIASDAVDGKWVSDIVCGGFRSGEELAERIMKKAEKLSSHSDDKTVMVIGIERYEAETREREA